MDLNEFAERVEQLGEDVEQLTEKLRDLALRAKVDLALKELTTQKEPHE